MCAIRTEPTLKLVFVPAKLEAVHQCAFDITRFTSSLMQQRIKPGRALAKFVRGNHDSIPDISIAGDQWQGVFRPLPPIKRGGPPGRCGRGRSVAPRRW